MLQKYTIDLNNKLLFTLNCIFAQLTKKQMKLKLITFFLLLPFFVFSQFEKQKEYKIEKTNNPPIIDGKLNDIAWRNLGIAKDFVQLTPNNGAKERRGQETKVQICYDDNAIYFGVMMFDNAPDSILKELSKRDGGDKNCDWFGIWIDPFNNNQSQLNFSVSAAGVQSDAKYTTTSIDQKWDAVWKSAVKITNNGWIAEFAIPFSALRFPTDNKDWSLNMARGIRRYREDYTWNFIDISFDNYGIQTGLLKGVNDIKSPLRLSFMPYVAAYADMYDGESAFPYNYGMDLKYGINKSFTLDMTLIPDFGQVAADDKVLNLSPFEIKYEEKRQFFTEGTEMFSKGEEMFYTRRVQDDLLNATKISGRTKNGLGIGLLNALTNKTEENPLSNYNVMIFDQAFGNNSSISLMNTHMVQKGSGKDANVTGLMTDINNKANTHSYGGDFKMSQEFEGENITRGYGGQINLNKTSGKYKYSLSSMFRDDKYNPNDMGFLMRNNRIENELSLSYNQFKPSKRFISSSFSLNTSYKTLFTNREYTNIDFGWHGSLLLKNYLMLGIYGYANPFEKVDYYEARTINYGMNADVENPFRKSQGFGGRAFLSSDYRKVFAVDFGIGGDLYPLFDGYSFGWRISPQYRLNDKIFFKYVLSVKDRYNDAGYATTDSLDNPIFAIRNTYMITNVFTASYIVNNKMDLSVKLRYHLDQVENLEFKNLGNDGYLQASNYVGQEDINYTTWTSDIAFNWWFAPGSQMSLVWKNAIENEDNILINHWTENVEESFNLLQQNSFSLKMVYYLDYLYLRKK